MQPLPAVTALTLILSHDRREWFAEYANFRNLALLSNRPATPAPGVGDFLSVLTKHGLAAGLAYSRFSKTGISTVIALRSRVSATAIVFFP